MARRKAKVGPKQKLAGYSILTMLGLIIVWLLVQQAHFNPAVIVASRGLQLTGGPQAVSGQALTATAALIPEVPGFTPLAPIQSFGPQNLSDKINGRAELYLSAGFKEMSCRSFNLGEKEKAYLEVFVYDMGSAPNAYAVFSGQRRPGSSSIALTSNAYITANALFFTQGRFYVELVGDRASAALKSSLENYAKALLAKIPSEGETTTATGRFPEQCLVAGSVRLCATDTFGMADFNNVFTGEYTLKNGSATAFLAERDTPEQAKADARRYQDFLTANGYQKIPPPGAAEDLQVLKLDNSFEIIFVQDRTLGGVHDASSLEVALDLAATLKSALKGKP
jgi:hypothetical protein